MGFFNPRAICPNCGGKVHTQKDFSVAGTKGQPWGRASAQTTGRQCQHCGVGLTGRIVHNMGEIDYGR